MKTLKTVTIGIPAHNEQAGIIKLLESIFMQKRSLFKLEKILIICDGCTDKTFELASEFSRKHKQVEVVNDGNRLGKSKRLNQIYKLNKSDIVITFDADTVLGHSNVTNEIVKEFRDEKVGLVGGSDLPRSGKNWVQKMAVTWIMVWDTAKAGYKKNLTVNNHKGVVSALSRSLAKEIKVPVNIVGDDDFIYFKAKSLGYEFRFSKKAIVYFEVPANLRDFFFQTTRFLSAKHKIAKYFGDYIYEDYKVPMYKKIWALFVVWAKEPIYLPLAIIFQILQRILKTRFQDNYKNGLWKTIKSSKEVAI